MLHSVMKALRLAGWGRGGRQRKRELAWAELTRGGTLGFWPVAAKYLCVIVLGVLRVTEL